MRIKADNPRNPLGIGGARILLGANDGVARFFVAADVVSGGDGSKSDPWSLAFAASGANGAIGPGSQIILRGGDYEDPAGFSFSISGTADKPITIRAFPGETPRLDGAIPEFRDTPATAWEVSSVSAGHNVYKGTVALPLFGSGALDFYSGFVDIEGETLPLIPHKLVASLTSDLHEYQNPAAPYFMGPGISYDRVTHELFVRLDNSTSDAQCGRDVALVSDFDPRNHSLMIGRYERYGLKVLGSHLIFDGIQIDNYYGLIRVGDSTATVYTDIKFRRCTGQAFYFSVRLGVGDNVTFEQQCHFTGRMDSPRSQVAWQDIKGGDLNADYLRKSAIDGKPTNFEMTNCKVSDYFDVFFLSGGNDIKVHHNYFSQIWDDAWQMVNNLYNVDFSWNLIHGAGPSRDMSFSTPGTQPAGYVAGSIWIHHNVIDVTRTPIFWGRKGRFDFQGDFQCNPLSTHSVQTTADYYDFTWKVFHNTIISGFIHDSAATSYPSAVRLNNNSSSPAVVLPTGLYVNVYMDIGVVGHINNMNRATHEVYNNILVTGDGRPVTQQPRANSGREIYDGNDYWWYRTAAPTYKSIWRFLTTSTVAQINLQNVPYIQNPKTDLPAQAKADTQVYYGPGWEDSSVAVDPMLIDYVPTNPAVLVGAVDLTAKGWPGTEDYVSYRGAGPVSDDVMELVGV